MLYSSTLNRENKFSTRVCRIIYMNVVITKWKKKYIKKMGKKPRARVHNIVVQTIPGTSSACSTADGLDTDLITYWWHVLRLSPSPLPSVHPPRRTRSSYARAGVSVVWIPSATAAATTSDPYHLCDFFLYIYYYFSFFFISFTVKNVSRTISAAV